MLSTPVSGFRSPKRLPGRWLPEPATETAARAGAPGCGAGAVVEGTGGGAALEPAGSTLSVSCRISLMFSTRVSQNLFAETELTVAVELFCDPVGVVCPGCVPLTCVARTPMQRIARHVHVIDAVDAQEGRITHHHQVLAFDLPAHVDLARNAREKLRQRLVDRIQRDRCP